MKWFLVAFGFGVAVGLSLRNAQAIEASPILPGVPKNSLGITLH